MNKVKCDCGHANPAGTFFCESCGKPFQDETSETLLDMKYEGTARRSTTYKKTIIDKVWNFFSSVKVGVWLIVLTLIASSAGTIFPQQAYIPPTADPSVHYGEKYGTFGELYYQLGLHNLYNSWWYLLLVASIGVSLVICSIDRVVPLYKALKNQGVIKNPNFLKRQRLFSVSHVENEDEIFEKVKANLTAKKYTIKVENGSILAEKGRFSRWGPYVNHIGLIIFLGALLLRAVPGIYVNESIWVREGETKEIPATNGQYYVKNEKFTLEEYDKDQDKEVYKEVLDDKTVAKNYQSDVILYEAKTPLVLGQEPELTEVKDYSIRVNDPLKFDGYALYQIDYKLNELSNMHFYLEKKETKEKLVEVTVDLNNPQEKYDLGNGMSVEILNYFPDFYFDSKGEPNTKTKIPNNPAFVFKMTTPETPNGEVSFVAIKQTLENGENNIYKMAFKSVDTRNVTALTVHQDKTIWMLSLGGLIFMIGVIQGMYWQHRRLWIQRINGEIWVAGFTNKNIHGFKKDIAYILEGTEITQPAEKNSKGK